MTSEDDDDELFSNFDKDLGDDLIMEWAKVSIYLYFVHIIYLNAGDVLTY